MSNKTTLVLGASTKEIRYSNKAVRALRNQNINVVAIGIRKGEIADVEIATDWPTRKDIHTLTIYLGAPRQVPYYDAIVELKPKRIIFNPGAENEELSTLAKSQGIETLNACTLVMLATQQF